MSLRSALRDITNTSSLNSSQQQQNGPLKSILVNKGQSTTSRESMIIKPNSSQLLSSQSSSLNKSSLSSNNNNNNTMLGAGNSSMIINSSSNNNNNNNNNYMISTLVDFFSNENLGIDITFKTFREGDSSKLRFFLNHLFKQVDFNLNVMVPTPSEIRDQEKKQVSSDQRSRKTLSNPNSTFIISNANSTSHMTNKHSSISGLDEELIIEVVDYFKLPVQLNKRHFSITPQSNRNWQTMIQIMYHLICIVKHSRNLSIDERESELKQQQLIFFTFLSDLYSPFLENDQQGADAIINEWKHKFGSDAERCKRDVEDISMYLRNIQQKLQYFNTRKDPFNELEEKRVSLENDFQHLSTSILQNENIISQILHDLQMKKTNLSSLLNQSDGRKRENEMYQRQIEQQTITPLEVQNINREKSNLEEEEQRLTKQLNYAKDQLEIVKNQVLDLNEHCNLLTNQYNNTVLKIDQNLMLTSANNGSSFMSIGSSTSSLNRWRINDAKLKKSSLKQQLSTLQTQIQQGQETANEHDMYIHNLEQRKLDQEELIYTLSESYSKLDSLYGDMKRQHNEELSKIEKRIRATEEHSVRIHNEKLEWKLQLDQNEMIIHQLEETIAREEAILLQKKNIAMNICLSESNIVADHKQNFDAVLTSCEKSLVDSFTAIKEIAQFTTSEMQKTISK